MPAYSPQLNPVGRCWLSVKCKVGQSLDWGMDLRQAVERAFVEYVLLRCIAIKRKLGCHHGMRRVNKVRFIKDYLSVKEG